MSNASERGRVIGRIKDYKLAAELGSKFLDRALPEVYRQDLVRGLDPLRIETTSRGSERYVITVGINKHPDEITAEDRQQYPLSLGKKTFRGLPIRISQVNAIAGLQ